MIEVSLAVTINGRTVVISDGIESTPTLWADNEREAAIAMGFRILEQMCAALEVDDDPQTLAQAASEASVTTPEPEEPVVDRGQLVRPAMSFEVVGEAVYDPATDRLMPIAGMTDDAFNNPSHIVEMQDGDRQ